MKEKLSCYVVQDLLPNFVERLTSQETNQKIEEHLSGCEECWKIYEEMSSDVPLVEKNEVKNVKKFMNKTKIMYAGITATIVGVLGILICLIVDFAVNRTLTWSLISSGSILMAFITGYIMFKSKKHPYRNGILSITILVIPLLFLIQGVLIYAYDYSVWIWDIGIPVSVIWIIFVWLGLCIKRVTKINFLLLLGVMILLSIVGSALTEDITHSFNFAEFALNAGSNISAAILCFVFGSQPKIKARLDQIEHRNK